LDTLKPGDMVLLWDASEEALLNIQVGEVLDTGLFHWVYVVWLDSESFIRPFRLRKLPSACTRPMLRAMLALEGLDMDKMRINIAFNVQMKMAQNEYEQSEAAVRRTDEGL
jgi:hypothetical protein